MRKGGGEGGGGGYSRSFSFGSMVMRLMPRSSTSILGPAAARSLVMVGSAFGGPVKRSSMLSGQGLLGPATALDGPAAELSPASLDVETVVANSYEGGMSSSAKATAIASRFLLSSDDGVSGSVPMLSKGGSGVVVWDFSVERLPPRSVGLSPAG